MKDLDQSPIQAPHEIVAPVKDKVLTKFAVRHLSKGMKLYEFDINTHEGKEVVFKESTLEQANGQDMIHHKVVYRKDRYYCTAINMNNATRKYRKWYLLNERVKLALLRRAQQPIPESPSEAACESE
jgi:hypothetical protein